MTCLIDFAFLECENEDNVTWTIEMCCKLLKGLKYMLHEIVIDCFSLMNFVAKIFPTSFVLLC